jgi:hypothetical protein
MPTLTLDVDRDAREIFNAAAIASGTHDADAAFDVCRKLAGLEEHYRFALRLGADAPVAHRGKDEPGPASGAPGASSVRRMDAKFPGRCCKCQGHIVVGTPIAYDTTAKRAFHERCAP